MSALATVPVPEAETALGRVIPIGAVPEALEPLIARVIANYGSQHTMRAYRSALRRFLTWCDGRPFTRATVQDYRAHLIANGASPAKIALELASIRALAQEAMDCNAISQSTATAIMAVRGVPRQARRSGRWLTREEAKRLADAPDNARDRALLALLIGAGLRRAEVLSLTRVQVQQLGGRTVLADVCRKRGKYQTVVLSAWVAERLEVWLGSSGCSDGNHGSDDNTGRDEQGTACGPAQLGTLDTGDHIGRGSDHNRTQRRSIFDLSESGVFWLVEKWARAAGVKVAPHDLRRTASLLAIKGGADIRSVQAMLGHSSVSTTERYLKPCLELEDPACDRIQL